MRIPVGTTDAYVYFVAVDSTDFTTRETGLTTFTVYYSINGGVATVMTTPTVNETSAANMPGVYELLIDESGMTSLTAGNDTAELCLHITQASMAPVSRTIEIYRPETTEGTTLAVTSGACDTVTTLTGHTAQTGDSYARLGAPAGASVSADIAVIESQTDDIGVAGAGLTGLPAVTLADGAHGGTSAVITAERIVVASTTATEPAVKLTGNTTGAGLLATGGATGNGIQGVGGATSGYGMSISATGANQIGLFASGTGSGAGIYSGGGGSGAGIEAVGGATNAAGITASGGGSGAGIHGTGGANGDGILGSGGSSSGHGIDGDANAGTSDGIHGAGFGAGEGIGGVGGATGHGIGGIGGLTSGDGIHGEATTSGAGLKAVAAGASTDIEGTIADIATGGAGVDVTSIDGDATAATQLKENINVTVPVSLKAGTLSTTQFSTTRTEADDVFNDRVFIFDADTTTAALRLQAKTITDYANTNGVFTCDAFTTAPAATDTGRVI